MKQNRSWEHLRQQPNKRILHLRMEIFHRSSRKIVEAFESNISVLSMEEVEVYKKFKIHAEAFESCNKGEIIREGTPRFPVEFEQMIKGEK